MEGELPRFGLLELPDVASGSLGPLLQLVTQVSHSSPHNGSVSPVDPAAAPVTPVWAMMTVALSPVFSTRVSW